MTLLDMNTAVFFLFASLCIFRTSDSGMSFEQKALSIALAIVFFAIAFVPQLIRDYHK